MSETIPTPEDVMKVARDTFEQHITAGNVRFVVEATGADYAGMLHIFNGGQLSAVNEDQQS